MSISIRVLSLSAIAAAIAFLSWSGSAADAQTLMGYWPLEETLVTQPAVDASGNGLHGSYENGVNPNVPGAPGFGSGADFDGAFGQIRIGTGFATGLGNLQNNFTLMAWINPDGFASKNRVMGASPNAAWGWGTAGDSLQITTFGVRDYTQPVPLLADAWTHAAIVLDLNNDAHFYVNGNFIGTQAHTAPGNVSDNFFFIGTADGDLEHFDGQLDEVGVFSGTLTEMQIQRAMNQGVANYNVPEPSTLLLAAVGLMGLIGFGRRRRHG